MLKHFDTVILHKWLLGNEVPVHCVQCCAGTVHSLVYRYTVLHDYSE